MAKSKPKRLKVLIGAYVLPSIKGHLIEMARAKGINLSELLTELITDAIQKDRKP